MDPLLFNELIESCYHPERGPDILKTVEYWLNEHSDATVARPLSNNLRQLCAALFGTKGSQKKYDFLKSVEYFKCLWVDIVKIGSSF